MHTPGIKEETSEPTKYHCYDSCNKCGGVNEYEVTDSLNGYMMECKTECKICSHRDYWAHGFFESSQEMESKCQTYNFKQGS